MANILLNTGFKQAFSLPLMSFYYEVNSSGDKFEQYRLLHVIHYKNKDVIGAAHEFLILGILSGTQTFYVRVERRPTLRASNVSGSVADDSISREQDFDLEAYKKKYDMVTDHRCPRKPVVRVSDICEIFCAMHKISPNYELLKYQCYWLCSTFLRKLERLDGGKPSTTNVSRGKEAIAGKWARFVPIITERKVQSDIKAAEEREEDEVKKKEEREDGRINAEFVMSIQREKKKTLKQVEETQAAVTPLLITSRGKGAAEELAVRSAFSRLVVHASKGQ
ncbi:hypothetical protein POSPLADRAFT_1060011 [Postia placenta MAD-698-R-SB12]|uniref:Uncharacterized protein n=1 Tax=Postia placenta MAD-698-R-SB12 TaxID=670580 RepID=A0A1X6MRW5_9APHY|nr:hypothetical protein POSPLADRAFT_1060011 [Postia placenta MAD-698-R-SB12]OSX58923.1 hypothetical protein POSPLADRAFT_1060011 [Postia placenta MAD-698-R-SB12]